MAAVLQCNVNRYTSTYVATGHDLGIVRKLPKQLMAKTEPLNEVATLPQPLKSAEDAVKNHRKTLQATLDNARTQKQAHLEQYHQWTGAEAILEAAIKNLDDETASE